MAFKFQILNNSYAKASWEELGGSENGADLLSGVLNDKTVQVVGTFGGATVTIQGSMDGTNWATLTDAQGNALTFTTAGIGVIAENPQFIRPATSGGTGSDIDVFIGARAVA